MKSEKNTFTVRVRFNWGFHDAQAEASWGDAARDMAGHFDRAYGEGYVAGLAEYRETGKRNQSSEPAWQRHRAHEAA